MRKDEVEKELFSVKEKLEEERDILNKMAKECLDAGKGFSNDPMLFKQTRIVDELVISEQKLRKVLEDIED